MNNLEAELAKRISDFENPQKIALSKKYPWLKRPIIITHQLLRRLKNSADNDLEIIKQDHFLNCKVARHRSVLKRKLGDSSPRLQEQKIINLRQAIRKLNGLIIPPGKVFSLWQALGRPKYEEGYVDGMLISNGMVTEGLGGGLCQLSNFLFWIFLHAPIEILERHHHSLDIFPDSGRILPFGSGATIFYNYIDLKIRNTSNQPLQLKLWLTDSHLKGEILSTQPIPEKAHVVEEDHLFVKRGEKYYRFNKIFRETRVNGELQKREQVVTNFAPTRYHVTDQYLSENGYKVIDFSNKDLGNLMCYN